MRNKDPAAKKDLILRRRKAPSRRMATQRAPLHQPALRDRGLDEGRKQRVRLEGPRLQLGMELHADEPGMVLIFHDLRQHAVGRETREFQAMLLEAVLVGGVDLVAMTMTLRNLGRAAIDI